MNNVEELELELAEKAYNAYGQSTNFKNFLGQDMPKFTNLPEAIKKAWIAAIECIVYESISEWTKENDGTASSAFKYNPIMLSKISKEGNLK